MRNKRKTIALFLTIITLFAAGVIKLFSLRFEAGDIYPPYSSLRSDPLGSMVFFESLENLDGVIVLRNLQSLRKLKSDTPFTFLFIGSDPYMGDHLDKPVFEKIDHFIKSGGRLVVAYTPVSMWDNSSDKDDASSFDKDGVSVKVPSGDCPEASKESADNERDEPEKSDTTEENQDESKESDNKTNKDDDEPGVLKMVSLSETWGLTLKYTRSDTGGGVPHAEPGVDHPVFNTFKTVSWHSTLWFDDLAPEWQVIYRLGDKPVIIERPYGEGTIVLSSDSYYLSNESLRNEKHPGLLAWIVGDTTRVVFDESHLGIVKNPGIATLVRKYNLHGFVASLLVFSLLFIWKNSTSFVPPVEKHDYGTPGDPVSARDHSSGLASLLRRNVNKKNLLDVCINEWKKSFVSDNEASKHNAELYKKMKMTVESGEGGERITDDPVAGYRVLCRILSEGKNA